MHDAVVHLPSPSSAVPGSHPGMAPPTVWRTSHFNKCSQDSLTPQPLQGYAQEPTSQVTADPAKLTINSKVAIVLDVSVRVCVG